MKFTINVRQECSREAFQLWLDSKSGDQKLKVISVRAAAPCNVEIEVEERQQWAAI
jgi:hypothetical protein